MTAAASSDDSAVIKDPVISPTSKSPPPTMSKEAKALIRGRRDLYTSFEDSSLITVSFLPHQYSSGGRPRGRRISPPPAKDSVDTKELTIQKDAVVTFFGRDHFLSNFYKAPFTINGHQYPTVEHYYEACKVYSLVGTEWARSLQDIPDPGAAKSATKRMLLLVSRSNVDKWRMTDGILVTKVAMTEKFRQNGELTEKLFATGDQLLVHCNKSDYLWSSGFDVEYYKKWLNENDGKKFQVPLEVSPDVVGNFPKIGRGRNLLGFIIMNVRDQLRREKTETAQDGSAVVGGTGPGIGSETAPPTVTPPVPNSDNEAGAKTEAVSSSGEATNNEKTSNDETDK